MDLMEAIEARHSVSSYKDKLLTPEHARELLRLMERHNEEAGLHLQLVLGEERAFLSRRAQYGKFEGVTCYMAMVGPKSHDLDEKVGYYGEDLVLRAQGMGLNTCWVGLTYAKVGGAFTVGPGEKVACVITVGYGETQGVPHKSKPIEHFCRVPGRWEEAPAWFKRGVVAASLAPTAMNQQKFLFTLNEDGSVTAKAGHGFYTKMDLGIAKYHFEVGAGKENFRWM